MVPDNPIHIDDEVRKRIESFARANGLSSGEVIRKAFEKLEDSNNGNRTQLDEPKDGTTVFDRWSRHGLIGCVDDPHLPRDLSTNRKHFEGFGRD